MNSLENVAIVLSMCWLRGIALIKVYIQPHGGRIFESIPQSSPAISKSDRVSDVVFNGFEDLDSIKNGWTHVIRHVVYSLSCIRSQLSHSDSILIFLEIFLRKSVIGHEVRVIDQYVVLNSPCGVWGQVLSNIYELSKATYEAILRVAVANAAVPV